jgi:GntR family transcriptional regulator/MocR family aminotransferase
MDSPVKIPYESFIKIDRKSETSIYLQIANQLINAIQRGFLPFGTKLPGTEPSVRSWMYTEIQQ